MKNNPVEIVMGAVILLAGCGALYTAYASSQVKPTATGYKVTLRFNKVGGLQEGNAVRTVCYLRGNKAQLEELRGKSLRIRQDMRRLDTSCRAEDLPAMICQTFPRATERQKLPRKYRNLTARPGHHEDRCDPGAPKAISTNNATPRTELAHVNPHMDSIAHRGVARRTCWRVPLCHWLRSVRARGKTAPAGDV